jgi:hypothetical protein
MKIKLNSAKQEGKVMALSQKIRLLSMALPGGLKFSEVDGIKVMYLCHAPYELEGIIYAWITQLPARYRTYDLADLITVSGPEGLALTVQGWEEFVSWMTTVLREVLAGYRPHIPIEENDRRLDRGRLSDGRLYDRDGNSELIPGEWDSEPAQAKPEACLTLKKRELGHSKMEVPVSRQ